MKLLLTLLTALTLLPSLSLAGLNNGMVSSSGASTNIDYGSANLYNITNSLNIAAGGVINLSTTNLAGALADKPNIADQLYQATNANLTAWQAIATAEKQDDFTTGTGVTNTADVLSANLTPGANITFTTNAYGAIEIAGGNAAYKTTGTNYTLTVSDYIVGCTANGLTLMLPAAASAGAGKIFVIKDESGTAGASAITLDANGSETIDGALTKSMVYNYQSINLYCNGTAWFVH